MRGTLVGVGYKSTNDLCDDFSGVTGEVVDGGDRRTGTKGWDGGGNIACAWFWIGEWP